MPPRDPGKVQLDFPLLTADLIAQLRLTGTIGLMDFDPTVRPVFIVGDRDLEVEAVAPVVTPAQITNGAANNPAANQVIVDTGQLPAGNYDILLLMSARFSLLGGETIWEHRDAANAVTLSAWAIETGTDFALSQSLTFSMSIVEDERLRMISGQAGTGRISGTVHHRIRPAP